jgi:spore germination protein
MKGGQLRMLFISKRQAQVNILPILNTMTLDPEISDRLYLVVVEGDFISYLNNQIKKQQELIDFYLYKMLSHYEEQGEINVTNLHQFMESYFSPYTDPMVPLFIVKGNDLTYEGTALFQKGKMVGEITSLDDMLFGCLSGRRPFHKALPLPEQGITLGSVYWEKKVTVPRSGDVQIQIRIKGRVEEYQGKRDLSQPREEKQLTRELESVLKQKYTRIVHNLQQRKIDPLRIGEQTLGPFSQPYTRESWKAAWPNMHVHVDVRLQLESFGELKMEK